MVGSKGLARHRLANGALVVEGHASKTIEEGMEK